MKNIMQVLTCMTKTKFGTSSYIVLNIRQYTNTDTACHNCIWRYLLYDVDVSPIVPTWWTNADFTLIITVYKICNRLPDNAGFVGLTRSIGIAGFTSFAL